MQNDFLILSIVGPITPEDKEYFETQNWDYMVSKPLIGGDQLIDLMIGILPYTVYQISEIIKKYIENKRYIKFKIGDIVVENVTASELENVLNSALGAKKKVTRKKKQSNSASDKKK